MHAHARLVQTVQEHIVQLEYKVIARLLVVYALHSVEHEVAELVGLRLVEDVEERLDGADVAHRASFAVGLRRSKRARLEHAASTTTTATATGSSAAHLELHIASRHKLLEAEEELTELSARTLVARALLLEPHGHVHNRPVAEGATQVVEQHLAGGARLAQERQQVDEQPGSLEQIRLTYVVRQADGHTLRLVQVAHGASAQRLGQREECVDGRLAPRVVVRLARARYALEEHLERVGLDQLLARARVLTQLGEQLMEALLEEDATLARVELAQVDEGVARLR